MNISLTQLRQQLFQAADHVIATGEPLIIERAGVRLRLIREDSLEPKSGRLARLVTQKLVNGPVLTPEESPSLWSEFGGAHSAVAEPMAPYPVKRIKARKK
jgi:hypothetical protein